MPACPSYELDDIPLLLPSDALVQSIDDDDASIPPIAVTLLERRAVLDFFRPATVAPER